MLGAGGPGAEGGTKGLQALDGGGGDVHEREQGKLRARECRGKGVKEAGLRSDDHPARPPADIHRTATSARGLHKLCTTMARNTGSAQPAIPSRILVEVLLVIVLREVERTRVDDLRGDRSEPGAGEDGGVSVPRRQRLPP